MTLIAYDPVAQGGAFIAALEAAGVSVTLTPAGLMVSDAAAAATIAGDAAAILAQAQAQAVAAVNAAETAAIAAGYTYSGKVIETDAASQANIAAQSLAALASTVSPSTNPWNTGFYWVCADGSQLPLATASAMLTLGSAIGAYVSAVILYAASLRAAIATATSLSAVAAIVAALDTGWPGAS